jgi:predicted TIM-barrel fold metal-dependent hydrolase
MFGTDSCLRSDVKKVYPNVDFIRRIEEEKKISKDAVEKIKWKNAVELFKLKITD